MKKYIVSMLLSVCSLNVIANKDETIKQSGYLIFVDYTWFFQPCSDSTMDVYKSLNSGSFRITYGTDGFNAIFYNMEDSLFQFHESQITYKWKLNKEFINGDFRYIFCTIKYQNSFLMNNENMHPCMYEIYVNNKKYSLGCFFFQPKIIDVELQKQK